MQYVCKECGSELLAQLISLNYEWLEVDTKTGVQAESGTTDDEPYEQSVMCLHASDHETGFKLKHGDVVPA